MKYYFYLLYLCLNLCSCLADSEGSGSWLESWSENEEEHVDRPCSSKDMNCIRRVMAQYSHCKPSYRSAPDPLHLKQLVLPLANSNISYILNDAQVKGLNNAKIVEFYVNKKTDNMVIAVEIRDISFYTPKAVLRYHRRAKEPIVLADSSIFTYGLVTFTATIPNYEHLELSNAEVYTYVDDSNPAFTIGPNVVKSLDPVVIASFNKFANNIPENAKEAYVFLGFKLLSTFIQSSICDFGLELFSS